MRDYYAQTMKYTYLLHDFINAYFGKKKVRENMLFTYIIQLIFYCLKSIHSDQADVSQLNTHIIVTTLFCIKLYYTLTNITTIIYIILHFLLDFSVKIIIDICLNMYCVSV